MSFPLNRTLFFTSLCVFTLLTSKVFSQVPTVQDCLGAIPVCELVYSEVNAYEGTGNYLDEINSGSSCLGSGEKNGVWYSFFVQEDGDLSFSITPNDLSDDYDWAVFNLTDNDCSDIFANAELEVSCNYSGSPGATGPNGLDGIQNEQTVPVFAGEYYIINVSQYSTSLNGYVLDFSESTASINGCQPYYGNGVIGKMFNDYNENCLYESGEKGIPGMRAIINPGNIIVETDRYGWWHVGELPVGDYTITANETGEWSTTCPISQSFTVTDSGILTEATSFGFTNLSPCSKPAISINMPRMRPCFTDQKIYVRACNEPDATGVISEAYAEIELDPNLTVTSAFYPYTDLGNNIYRFDLDIINPGVCKSFWINTDLSCDVELGQTLCMQANLFPAEDCVFDTITTPGGGGVTPCELPWDKSSLSVEGVCENDSIIFTITNTGDFGNGDMDCYTPVRIYLDGDFIELDSIQLLGGETVTFAFSGDGRTWRLEADQHPLHPGNSHPNASVELCGNIENWTPGLVTIRAQDDADPVVDIYCGEVTGSYDPNDKKGTPKGLTSEHFIYPNGIIDYKIRFQNTGTDTAFTVVIRDTLDTDLNIFSVKSGASSHNYSFKMYGPRILEWTFGNILLVDSFTNEPGSHSFVSFSVEQNKNLVDGTEINNNAGIYFDFNDPIITNIASHTVNRNVNSTSWQQEKTVNYYDCLDFNYNGVTYTQSGEYFQLVKGVVDTLVTLNVTVGNNSSEISEIGCGSYEAPDGAIYTESGLKTAVIQNSHGCDSTILINLTVNQSTSIDITSFSCGEYIATDGTVYAESGNYQVIIPNSQQCDSLINIDLTVHYPTFSELTVITCGDYVAPDGQVYTESGIYNSVIQSASGCDSTITIDFTNQSSFSEINEVGCSSYTAPDGAVYTETGIYTAIIPNAQNCDSIITVNLVMNSTTSEITKYACEEYTSPDGNIYEESGVYTATISNSLGCDSIIEINLTVTNLDLTVTENDPVLSSVVENANYMWVNCDTSLPVSGAASQTFTASENGNYALIITQNGCTEVTECYNISTIGIVENSFEGNLILFPNPTEKGEVNLDLGKFYDKTLITITNVEGRIINTEELYNIQKHRIQLNEPAGIYLITITSENEKTIIKLIKNK